MAGKWRGYTIQTHGSFGAEMDSPSDETGNNFVSSRKKVLKLLPKKDERKKIRRSITKITPTLRKPFGKTLATIDSMCQVLEDNVEAIIENHRLMCTYKKDTEEMIRANRISERLGEIPDLRQMIKAVEEKVESSHTNKSLTNDRFADLNTRVERIDMKATNLHTQFSLLQESIPSATASFQSQLLKVETQARQALGGVHTLNEKFDVQGRRQLEELEMLCNGQVSLYLSGISNDIENLSSRVSALVKVLESQEKRLASVSDISEKKIQGLANDICNVTINLDTNQHIMLNLQNTVDEMRKQRRKDLKDYALRRAKPSYVKIDTIPSSNTALPANYPIYSSGEKQQTRTDDDLDFKGLKKRVENLEAENALVKRTLQDVLEKIGSFTELQINAFVRSEKQARKDVNKLKKVLLSFSDQLCLVTECYNGNS